jgi:glycogen operon protein
MMGGTVQTPRTEPNGSTSIIMSTLTEARAGTAPSSSFSFRGQPLSLTCGNPLPLGAHVTSHGVNFVVICRHGTAVSLVLAEPCSEEIHAEIPLDPRRNRTGDHWHIRVAGLPEEFCYGYRVDGPTGIGHCYDPSKILIDPAARSLSCGRFWGAPGNLPRRSLVNEVSSALAEGPGGEYPQIPREDAILYELHVRGYTVHPSSRVRHPGTFVGLTEKIEHLKALGVNAVELLPIDEFDENDCPFVNPFTGEKLRNFWGYNSISFAAPKAAYATNPERSAPWEEFRRMVKFFHGAGIEVVLDVVFNHTAEGDERGPIYNFKGLDNSLYYLLDEQGRYLNYTGCGNTVNSNHPVVRYLILSCLRNLVAEADIDGFRFDLASVLGRNRRGEVMVEPPVIESISEDALMADTKLIAEPWDAAGLYQVGSFPGGRRWSVWNGMYRDDVRRFWRGDPGFTSALATRLCGSDDLYHGRGPLHSVNFITCHDGFTLLDLVSYNTKHNEANGASNQDGMDANWSWNCGVEGPTDNPAVLALRRRQVRNFIATLMVSQGVPMLLAGDEFLRTQNGNNNAWCQDNETSWVEWTLAEKNADFLRFVRQLIALRLRHPALRRRTFFQGMSGPQSPDIVWHGVEPSRPDFSFNSHAIAFALDGRRIDRPGIIDRDFYIAMNAYWQPLGFRIPASPSGRPWRRTVDTALPSPDDAVGLDEGPSVPVGTTYHVEARSMIVLVSEEK